AYKEIERGDRNYYASDLVSYSSTESHALIPLLLGSSVGHLHLVGQRFEGAFTNGTRSKSHLVDTALMYLNAPFVSGGKTPFGIDSAGLTQMVYKINGYDLLRDAAEQAKQGEALSFIEESEEGDLAFFDNNEGVIDHVGIIMRDNYIIHAYGKVRIDRIDHTGIFDAEQGRYSHSLRVIKKIV
uniref:C40 family peptidase n=1 Tax=Zeaxanthinibacter enoshimensis TaxID=392009 RepID=UPI003568ECE0